MSPLPTPAREILVTEPRLVFLAGQYLALEKSMQRRANKALGQQETAEARRTLYDALWPVLRRAGYDEETAVRLDVRAGLNQVGDFAVTVSWHRDPRFNLLGDVIPAPMQAVPSPVYHEEYVIYRTHGETEVPIIVTAPILRLLLNTHERLEAAREDVSRLHARGNPTGQWRGLVEGVTRVERALNLQLEHWAPLLPPTIGAFLSTTNGGAMGDFAEAFTDPRVGPVGCYQFAVNALVDAVRDAEAQRRTAKARLAYVVEDLARLKLTLETAIRANVRKIDTATGLDIAPMRWRAVVGR